jgi:hypothetical protein
MSRGMVCSLFLGFALAIPLSAQTDSPPSKSIASPELKAQIAKAVKDLGAEAFETRQAAQDDLVKIGLAAERAVSEAASSPDPEVAGRAKAVLRELAKRKLDSELDKVNWSTILERVKQHAANENWKKPGFADPLLEGAVEKLVEQANLIAKEDRLQMPVRFGDVSAAGGRPRPMPGAGPPPRPGAGQLVCGQGALEFSFCNNSIFLIDGSVRIAHCSNCLIIARGAINIAHGSGNVVLAGHFIDVSHDGTGLRRGGPMPGGGAVPGSSLLMSGSILRVSNAFRSICSAPDEATVGCEDCVFLNCKPPADGRRVANKVIEKVNLQLQPIAVPNPIRDQLKITQVIDRGDSRPGFIVVEHGGVEVVVRPGVEIKDNLGKPVAALANWKLAFTADGYALLSNGKDDAGFVVPRR